MLFVYVWKNRMNFRYSRESFPQTSTSSRIAVMHPSRDAREAEFAIFPRRLRTVSMSASGEGDDSTHSRRAFAATCGEADESFRKSSARSGVKRGGGMVGGWG